MRELMAHSVRLGRQRRGLRVPPGRLPADLLRRDADDVLTIHEHRRPWLRVRVHRRRGPRPSLHEGIFDDWRATGVSSVLHEKKGATPTTWPPSTVCWPRCRPRGDRRVRTLVPKLVVDGGAVTQWWPNGCRVVGHAVDSDRGSRTVGSQVVGDAGPARHHRHRLGGETPHTVPTWKFWALQEGTLDVTPATS
ncbi:MAG: hypothetical protein Ct9H300mP12_13440 [Acidimicrobiales bacterium]|nr:MAG: hypothetical protein Ct9H300mP12_13440 [Acidimicrobiales bacterium]